MFENQIGKKAKALRILTVGVESRKFESWVQQPSLLPKGQSAVFCYNIVPLHLECLDAHPLLSLLLFLEVSSRTELPKLDCDPQRGCKTEHEGIYTFENIERVLTLY